MVNEVAMQKADIKNVELIFHSLSLKSLGWGSCDSQAALSTATAWEADQKGCSQCALKERKNFPFPDFTLSALQQSLV